MYSLRLTYPFLIICVGVLPFCWASTLLAEAKLHKADEQIVEKMYQRPMQFFRSAPCNGDDNECFDGILAIGTVEEDSHLKLTQLGPSVGTAVYFNSPGGSLSGGLSLGKTIRGLVLDTVTGGEVRVEVPCAPKLTLSGQCASACAFAFLGGVKREVREPGAFLVHRFYKDYGLVSNSEFRNVTALLRGYFRRMGISEELIQGVLRTESSTFLEYSPRRLSALRVTSASY